MLEDLVTAYTHDTTVDFLQSTWLYYVYKGAYSNSKSRKNAEYEKRLS